MKIKPGEWIDDVGELAKVLVSVSLTDRGKLALMVCPNPPPVIGGGGCPTILN